VPAKRRSESDDAHLLPRFRDRAALVGYAGGLERKEQLLRLEGARL
jgi:hypothetical protein